MKRFLTLILASAILISVTACGDNATEDKQTDGSAVIQDAQTEGTETPVDDRTDIKYKSIDLFEKIEFFYDAEWPHMDTTYGGMLFAGNYIVLISSPAAAGTPVSAETLEEIPALCESCVITSLELLNDYFYAGQTIRESESSTSVKVNDLDMMREEGTLYNAMDDITYPYTAFYFKTPNKNARPICVMGVMLASDDDIGAAMDEYIKNVKIMQ